MRRIKINPLMRRVKINLLMRRNKSNRLMRRIKINLFMKVINKMNNPIMNTNQIRINKNYNKAVYMRNKVIK